MLSLPHDDDVKITEKQKADATAADAAEPVVAEKAKAEAATVAVEKAVDTSVRIPKVGQIYISEVMFAGGGTLPQWIEIFQRFPDRAGESEWLDADGRECDC